MTTVHDGPALSVDFGAELCAHLGSIRQLMEQERADRLSRAAAKLQLIRPIPLIPVPQITSTNGTADYPELCSPRTGWWWDVHRVTVNTFSAGTVNLYLTAGGSGGGTGGALADTNQVYAFTTKGTLTFGKGQLLVPASLRLVFSAAGITGNASPAIGVTEIHQSALADYLL